MRAMYRAIVPIGDDVATATCRPDRVPECQGVLAPDPDLVAQVARVAGPRDAHGILAILVARWPK